MFKLHAKAHLPTLFGDFEIYVFDDDGDPSEHAVLVKGDVYNADSVPVRIHSECLTGDVFGSKRCDCREQLVKSLEMLSSMERGILIYLRQEGRGIGLKNKIKAYSLQENGFDTVEANLALGLPVDSRDYTFAINVLHYFGISRIKLMSNNPLKFQFLQENGIDVIERIPLITDPRPEDKFYLETKRNRMGHQL
ncbi:MAG: GTP cyclohydrolase II [Candidatus Thermoplasmatota archaeon]|nr:GTP cyclohydrolase II [Candidatus Thermoplasmatota archaeon]